MAPSDSLIRTLEDCLRSEGLLSIIAPERRSVALPSPIAPLWLAGMFLIPAAIAIDTSRFNRLPELALCVVLAFLLSFVPLSIRLIRGQSTGVVLQSDKTASTIGGYSLLAPPLATSLATGIILQSPSSALWCLALSYAWLVVVFALHLNSYRIHLLIALSRSTVSILWRSILSIPLLVPILFTVVIMGSFSPGLWATLGTLPTSSLIAGIALLSAPAIAMSLATLGTQASLLLPSARLPSDPDAIAESIPAISSRLHSGLISREEWSDLVSDVTWRPTQALAYPSTRLIQARLKRWLAITLLFTAIGLVGSFFVYFILLYSAIIPVDTLAEWTSITSRSSVISFPFAGTSITITLPSTLLPVSKASAFIATLLMSLGVISSMTSEPVRAVVTSWLRTRAHTWLAVSSLYGVATSPGYFILDFRVRDQKRGIANVSIVLPQGTSTDAARAACEHMEKRLVAFRRLVLVTAFELNSSRPEYRLELPGNKWRLLHNKSRSIRNFTFTPVEYDEPRFLPHLGRESLLSKRPIPDEWFGEEEHAVALSKAIWDNDQGHEWILHPYVQISEATVSLEISFTKRMASSAQYAAYMRNLVRVCSASIPQSQQIYVDIFFRDTADILARFFWNSALPTIEYKDEHLKVPSTQSASKWLAAPRPVS